MDVISFSPMILLFSFTLYGIDNIDKFSFFYFNELCRSYNALRGSPLVLKLIPAVGVIAFASWGLGPLMRLSRIIFLQVFNPAFLYTSFV